MLAKLKKSTSQLHHLYQLNSNSNRIPDYFVTIKNVRYRTAFSKLRLMSDYNATISPHTLCSRCALSESNPHHVLMECPVYSDIRKIMLDKILLTFNHFKKLTSREQVLFLMSDVDIVSKTVAKFAYNVFKSTN